MQLQKVYLGIYKNLWWVVLVLFTLLLCVSVWRFFDYKIEKVKYEYQSNLYKE